MFMQKGLYFAPDTGNATGAPAAPTPPADNAGNGESGSTGQNSGQPPSGDTALITFKSREELQTHIEQVLKERLEREKRKSEKATSEAREQAEQDALAKNAEWQKLAESRETKINELKKREAELLPWQEKAERYEKALKAHLETQRTGLPQHVLVLLDKLDVTDQLEYIAKNREALAQPQGQPPRPAGIPPTPPPAGSRELSKEEQERAQTQAGLYYQNRF